MAEIYKVDASFDHGFFKGTSCAFGVFDGVHRGHRYLLDCARSTAAETGGASVALTELFLDGTLAAGPMVAGLLVSGGVGLLVLWRTNADLRQNAAVTGFVYAVGVAVGLLVGAAGMMF